MDVTIKSSVTSEGLLEGEREKVLKFVEAYKYINRSSRLSVGKGLNFIPTGTLSEIIEARGTKNLTAAFKKLTPFELSCLRENGLFISNAVTSY